ncbi:MAG: helix-turn-helix domain-containing protein [Magnetococcus sp. DMHC-1]|nr:XRE family transcriptional regulator [Magnetococcales bacterium]
MEEPVVITKSCGNVFLDLGFPPDEAKILAMRADLMVQLGNMIDTKGWTQEEAAGILGISQSRVSNLVRGRGGKFSLDTLVTLALRAGMDVNLSLAA